MASRLLASRIALRSLSTAAGQAARASSAQTGASFRRSAPKSAPTVAAALMCATGIGATVAYAAAPVQPAITKEEVAAVAAAINDLLDNDEEDGLGPTLVRLAWHASGTYDKETGTGGSEGATMRFAPESEHAANAGLQVARDALEPIKKLFPNITYADLWTLAGAVAIEHMGGPNVVWRPGRLDANDASECTRDGLLPDADKGQIGKTVRHIREIFYRQGFNDREIVALIGAHALGRCYKTRSGYDGPWTRSPTTFSNMFYRELVENTWTLKQWDGPDQFEDPSGDLMMLPTDMALLWDKEFRKYTLEYAKDEELFFKSFAAAFQKLEENGVRAFATNAPSGGKAWYKFW